jgi:hypothetical protein
LAFKVQVPTAKKVTTPAEIEQIPGVAEVIETASPDEELDATDRVPPVTVLEPSEANEIVLVPCRTVNVKVAVVEAKFESVGVNVPVMTTVPGFSRLKTAPDTSCATVESLEAKVQVPASEPDAAAEVAAGGVTV